MTAATARAPVLALALTLVVADAVRADDERAPSSGPRCPGDNAAFFEEIEEAGWVGYGETWDHFTCDEGLEIYADGATRAWRAMRPRLARPRGQILDEEDVLFYATALPYGAFGSLLAIFAIAWLISLVQRRKHAPAVIVTCAGCGQGVPVRAEEGGVFCPACGTAALVDVGNPGRL